MNAVLNDVLKSIDGELLLNIDGLERSYVSGAAALEFLNSTSTVVYAIQKIGVKDGKVYMEVCDQTDAIARQNKVWMEEETARIGVEPGFF